jgi:hypothetical protein
VALARCSPPAEEQATDATATATTRAVRRIILRRLRDARHHLSSAP